MAGLQDFFTHYKSDTSPTKSFESEASATTLMSSTSDDRAAKDPLTLPPVVSSPAKSCESEVTCAVATLMSSTSDEPANLVDDKIASSSLQVRKFNFFIPQFILLALHVLLFFKYLHVCKLNEMIST